MQDLGVLQGTVPGESVSAAMSKSVSAGGTVIGIAGASCSGKSTVAKAAAAILRARVYNLDDYWISGLTRPIVNGHPTYERPFLYDGNAMAADIRRAVSKEPGRPVVAEGFLLFLYPSLVSLCAPKAFIHVPDKIIAERRAARAWQRGEHPEGPNPHPAEIGWLAHGFEEWRRFGAKQKDIPGTVTLDGTLPVDDLARMIVTLAGPGR